MDLGSGCQTHAPLGLPAAGSPQPPEHRMGVGHRLIVRSEDETRLTRLPRTPSRGALAGPSRAQLRIQRLLILRGCPFGEPWKLGINLGKSCRCDGKRKGGERRVRSSRLSAWAVVVGRSGCFVHAVPSTRRQELSYLALALSSRRQPCAALGPFPQRCRGPRAVPRPCSSTSVSPRLGSKRPGPEGPGAQKHARSTGSRAKAPW